MNSNNKANLKKGSAKMDNITNLTVHELVEKLKSNELTSEEITKAYIDRINDKEKDRKRCRRICNTYNR